MSHELIGAYNFLEIHRSLTHRSPIRSSDRFDLIVNWTRRSLPTDSRLLLIENARLLWIALRNFNCVLSIGFTLSLKIFLYEVVHCDAFYSMVHYCDAYYSRFCEISCRSLYFVERTFRSL